MPLSLKAGLKAVFISSTIFSSMSCSATVEQNSESTINAQQVKPSFPLSSQKIEQTMREALTAFNTPSVSVAITYQGETVFSGAQGLRNIKNESKAMDDTYYRLASLSKAFTAAAIGVLVDQGKVDWSDKVIDHLPEFAMQDAWVTREFTVKDLLSHRSGLVSAAGDSMIWPEPSGFSRKEVVYNLRYLRPEYSFRDQYAYSNVLYITAGELVSRLSGIPFEDFVEQYIFAPLDMKCFAGDLSKQAMKNVAMSYGFNDQKGNYPIPRNRIHGKALMSSAAGGMVCNAQEMTKWMNALLDKDALPFTKLQLAQMWSPQTILNVSDNDEEWDGTLFKNYGLGWRLSNLFEHKMISHTGTLSGYQAYIALVPDFDLGVVVLNNGSNYGVRGAIMQTIIKSVLSKHKGEQYSDDWVKNYVDYQSEREQAYLARNITTPEGSGLVSLSEQDILGVYKDKWYGEFKITKQDTLRIQHNKMQTLSGTVLPFEGHRFKVEWDNSNAQRDAFLNFQLDVNSNIKGMSMHPFVSNERIAHEYRDMYFIKM